MRTQYDLQVIDRKIPTASNTGLFLIGSIITFIITLVSCTAYANYYITFCIFGFFLLAGIFLYKPQYLYYLIIFFTCFYTVVLQLWSDPKCIVTIGDILIILCFFCWFTLLITKRGYPYQFNSTDIPLILLIVLATVSMLWTDNVQFGAYLLGMFYIAIIFFMLTGTLLNDFKKIKTAAYCYIGMGVINSMVCAWFLHSHYFYRGILGTYKTHRVMIIFNPAEIRRGQGFLHTLTTGYTLSLALILLIGLIYINRSRLTRILLSCLAFFIYSAQISTLSKGPLLSLFSGLMVFSLTIPKLKKNLLITWICIFALTIMAFFASRILTNDISRAIDYTSKNTTKTSSRTASLGSRIIRWEDGLYGLYQSYGIGTGSGGYFSYISPDFNFDNAYLHVLVDYGFVGAWLWLWFLYASCRRFISAYLYCTSREKKLYMLTFIACFVTALVNAITSVTHLFLPLWFAFGIGHALAHNIESKRSQIACEHLPDPPHD